MQILLKEALLQQNGVESNQKVQKKKKFFSVMHFFPDSKNIKSHLFEDLT